MASMSFLENAPAISAAAAVVSALVQVLTFCALSITLIKTLIEYRLQIKNNRFRIFIEFSDHFSSKQVIDINRLLRSNDQDLLKVDPADKRNMIDLYERLAISVNSGIINEDIAFYMFGYYAVRMHESSNFWKGNWMPSRDSEYVSLFNSFAQKMSEKERDLLTRRMAPLKLRF